MKKSVVVVGAVLALLVVFGANRWHALQQRRAAAHQAFQARMAAWPGARVPVTFSFSAPQAREVFLAGEMTDWDHEKVAMTRGEDGVWHTTVALAPGQWVYKFVVDGTWVHDPANPLSDKDGQGGRHSFVLVGQGDWQAPADAPRGKVETFQTSYGGLTHVYLPPDYQAGKTYPLLLMLHGSGADADQWYRTGLVDRFMDSLIGQRRIQPFIVVMASVRGPYEAQAEAALLGQLLPQLRRQYGVTLQPASTAVTGMSLGGFGAFYLAQRHPEVFGLSMPVSGVFSQAYRDSLPRPLRVPFRLHILCGGSDFLLADNHALRDLLRADGVAFEYAETNGRHEWHYWNGQLADMLTRADRFFQSGQ